MTQIKLFRLITGHNTSFSALIRKLIGNRLVCFSGSTSLSTDFTPYEVSYISEAEWGELANNFFFLQNIWRKKHINFDWIFINLVSYLNYGCTFLCFYSRLNSTCYLHVGSSCLCRKNSYHVITDIQYQEKYYRLRNDNLCSEINTTAQSCWNRKVPLPDTLSQSWVHEMV